jgi:hypothetical protein
VRAIGIIIPVGIAVIGIVLTLFTTADFVSSLQPELIVSLALGALVAVFLAVQPIILLWFTTIITLVVAGSARYFIPKLGHLWWLAYGSAFLLFMPPLVHSWKGDWDGSEVSLAKVICDRVRIRGGSLDRTGGPTSRTAGGNYEEHADVRRRMGPFCNDAYDRAERPALACWYAGNRAYPMDSSPVPVFRDQAAPNRNHRFPRGIGRRCGGDVRWKS